MCVCVCIGGWLYWHCRYFGLGQVTNFDFAYAVGNAFKSGDLSGLSNFAGGLFESDKVGGQCDGCACTCTCLNERTNERTNERLNH